MNKGFTLVILLLVGIFSSLSVYATHAVGADISYKCLGNNQYEITLNVYRDCNGISLGNKAHVDIKSNTCNVSTGMNLNRVFWKEISQVCIQDANNTACHGGPLPGIQQHQYKGTFTFPRACADWTISFSLTARNGAITNLQSPGSRDLYVEATLNNTNGICNNSPEFGNLPVPYICQGEAFNFNHGTIEQDGDQLTFTLIAPKHNGNTNIGYVGSYSPTNPLSTTSGFNFNNTTGQFSFTPQPGLSQQAVVTIKIVETNSSGVVVGTTMRDMQIVVVPCPGAVDPPTCSGINGTGVFTYDICYGSPFCFDIPSNDITPGDTVTMTANMGIPGATIAISGSPFPTASFCWTPGFSDIGPHIFSITLADNACPILSTNSYTFQINVTNGTDPNVVASPDQQICPGSNAIQLNATAGPGATFNWTPSTGLSCTNCPDPVATTSSSVVYTVSASYPSGCSRTDNVLIDVLPGPTVSVFPKNPRLCIGGSIPFTAVTTAPNITWEDGQTGANITYSPTAAEYFTVSVTDGSGCVGVDSTYIALSTPPTTPFCVNYYVTPGGTGDGLSPGNPSSLNAAILATQCSFATIKIAQGDYYIDSAITQIIGAVTLEGGYDAGNNWIKSSQPGATRIIRTPNNPQGPAYAPRLSVVEMLSSANFRFQDITFEVQNAPTADSVGVSIYGLHLDGCNNYSLVRCQVITGNASNGIDGINGANGVDGSPGSTGTTATCNSSNCIPIFGSSVGPRSGGNGGNGGNGVAAGVSGTGRNGGGGGNGGDGSGSCSNNSTAGSSGGGSATASVNNTGGSAGNQGDPGQAGGNGTNGTNGIDGIDGITSLSGVHNLGFYEPGSGTDGTSASGGSGGSGGGGGGRNDGSFLSGKKDADGGSGGGGGGQGGQKGTKGYGGGSNYGVYLNNNGASANFIDCNITTGQSGQGGAGGNGGSGGAGGTGGAAVLNCNTDVGSGGSGGNGGNGGNAGDGGSGANGEQISIYINGTAPVTLDSNFNLTAQPVIEVENISCTYTDINFTSPSSGSWNFGSTSTNPTPSGANVITQYNAIGRKDVVFSGNTYSGFIQISFSGTVIPDINCSADTLPTGEYLLCKGSSTDFWTTIQAVNYAWDFGGATTPNTYSTDQLTGLVFNTPGTFTVVLSAFTDCCGWTPYDSVTIIVDDQPTLSVSGNNTICRGESTTITLTTTSDSIIWTPNLYLSSDHDISVVASPIDSTSYAITAYSDNGACTIDSVLLINVNTPPDLSNTSSVGTICGNDGQASVNPTGGSGNYTYNWDNGQTTQTAINLYSGNYNVTVTDANNGCSDSVLIYVPNINSPYVYISNSIDVSCYQGSDGSATADAGGGVTPYTYTWTNSAGNTLLTGVGSLQLNNLSAGSYQVSISDNNGCTAIYPFSIGQPDTSVYIIVVDTIAPTCPGLKDGYVEVLGDGGSGSFTYQWDDIYSSTTNYLDGFDPDTFTVTVTDINNCTATMTFPFAGNGPPITVNPGAGDTLCGNTFEFNAQPVGANGHWVYYGYNNINFVPSANTPDPQVFVNNYGSYNFYWVEDNGFGCLDSDMVTVLFVELPVADAGSYPPTLCAQELVLSPNPSVGSGSWSLTAGPTSVSFSPASNIDTPRVYFNGYGLYSFQWEENNGYGCISTDPFSINIIPPPFDLIINVDTNAACMPERLFQFSIDNDTSIITSYDWDFGNGYTSEESGSAVLYSQEGCFDVTLTVNTDDGCVISKIIKDMVCMHPNPEASFSYNPNELNILEHEATLMNTTAGDNTYVWYINDLGLTYLGESWLVNFPDIPAQYDACMVAVNEYFCTDTVCQIIDIKDMFFIYVPNTFTPNEDKSNELFGPVISGALKDDYVFTVFDRWGNVVFESPVLGEFWDGKYKGIDAPEDVYAWKVIVYSINEVESNRIYTGHVNLIR